MTIERNIEALAQEFRVYTATLSLVIKMCEEALELLADINDGKILFPTPLKKAWCKEMLLNNLIVELRKLVDRKKGTISFERLAADWKGRIDAELLNAYKDGLEKAKRRHGALIKRIERNRHVKGAHIQRKEELGFDPKMARMLNEWNEATGDPRRYQPVNEGQQHLLLSTLPRAEIVALLSDFESLIHFGLWRLPNTD